MTRRSASHGMRIFLTLWLGQFVSMIGTGLGSFALGVWIFEKTGSATRFAFIAFVAGITMLVVSPLAGALADRWDRRRLLLMSDLGSAAMTLIIGGLLFTGRMQPAYIYPMVVVMVTLAAFQSPALLASISLLVPRDQLARASGMTQTARAVSQIIGPLAAGVLVGRIGYHGLILIDTLTFLFAACTIFAVRIPQLRRDGPAAAGSGRSLLGDLAYGWSYLRRMPGLLALLALFGVTNFCMGMVQVLLTPLILSFASPLELGSVNSAGAAGVLLGGLTISIWGGPRRRVRGILAVLAVQAVILFLGGVQPSIPLIALASFCFMFTLPFITSSNQAILQSKVALDVQGRVFAVAGMIAAGTIPLAALTAGPLADRVFGPLLENGGALTRTAVGRLLGVGPGRGEGLMFILLGALVLIAVGVASLNPRLRQVETEIPDAIHPEPDPAAASVQSEPSLSNA
jgi:DHA3 family macrolide efflux protein-like MFS transporter